MSHEPSCYTTSSKYHACIEFQTDEYHRHGFSASQLIDYKLLPNPEAEDNKSAAPQRLFIAFSTADVVILGSDLGLLADNLRESELAIVRVLPKRYSGLQRHMPSVTAIQITEIEESKNEKCPVS